MKRLFVLIIAFGLIGNLSAKKLEISEADYQIKLSLDMPSIKDVGIINALVDFDPLAKFKKEIIKHEGWTNNPDDVAASVAWDISIFDEVKASYANILEQKKLGRTHVLSGNIKNKKMWLVTKATVYGKKPLVWVVPLDIKEGFKADVVLNKKNAINLVDLYKQIVAEAAKK